MKSYIVSKKNQSKFSELVLETALTRFLKVIFALKSVSLNFLTNENSEFD